MIRTAFVTIFCVSLLAGCGKSGALERTPSMGPQPVAYGAQRPEDSGELTRPSTQAVPGRSSALINSADPRGIDPFDLPPGARNVEFPGDPLTADEDGGDGDDRPSTAEGGF